MRIRPARRYALYQMSLARRETRHEVRALVRRDDRHYLIVRPQPLGDEARWDFPGGPVAARERYEDAIRRTCHAQLGALIDVLASQPPVNFNFGTHVVEYRYFLCRLDEQLLNPADELELRWVLPAQMHDYYFDRPVQQAVDWLVDST